MEYVQKMWFRFVALVQSVKVDVCSVHTVRKKVLAYAVYKLSLRFAEKADGLYIFIFCADRYTIVRGSRNEIPRKGNAK